MGASQLYTIGHSSHSTQAFLALLQQHGITAVADVRSSPFSRHYPQFNKDTLAEALRGSGIAYVFLGKELGARPDDPTFYDNGSVAFDKIARSPSFTKGIERILDGMQEYRVALLCAEKEPLNCHRTILVCRHLSTLGVRIKHILADGRIEEHSHAERRLLKQLGLEPGLFDPISSDAERIELAYNQRGREIAYRRPGEERSDDHRQ